MNWRDKLKRFDKNADVIFDREEPVGQPTDLVLPDRRWFGRRKATPAPRVAAKANA
ncbi:MAG: hypothetical protein M3Y69_07850 [Verrucomicrobiota bacterium]|nr:hypothetical protein [Verrucomicrobiota bacterium]